MTRHTSVEAYKAITSQGILGKLQLSVYDALFNNGPLTEGELWSQCFSSTQRHSVAPRFAELEKMGAIQVIDERPCGYSGKTCLVWDVTEKVPTKLQRPKPYKQLVKEFLKTRDLTNDFAQFAATH